MKTKSVLAFSAFCISFCCLINSMLAQANFWQQTNGPFGLPPSVAMLAIASDSVQFMYASTFNPTKIYSSTDEGENWVEITSVGTEVYGLITNHSREVFAATYQGVFRSTDHGQSWTRHANGLTTTQLICITVVANGDLLVGTWYQGVFRSTNRGENWTQSGLMGVDDIDQLYSGPGGLVFARHPTSVVYRSTNFGQTWDSIPSLRWGASSFAFDSFDRVYASAYRGPVYRSTNGGVNWDSISSGLQGYVDGSTITTDAADNVYLIARGIFRSSNAGETWSRADQRLATFNGLAGCAYCDIRGVIRTPSDNLAIGANVFGVFRSENYGLTWKIRSKGLGFPTVSALAASRDGSLYLGTSAGVFYSSDRGEKWDQRDTGIVPYRVNALLFDRQQRLFSAGQGGVFRSIDGGSSWLYNRMYATAYSLAQTRNQTLLASDWYINIMPATAYARIYRSTDDGFSWNRVFQVANAPIIRAMGQIRDNVFAGCYKSTNDGVTWQPQGTGGLCISTLIQNRLGQYLGSKRDSIYRSTDEGITWVNLASLGSDINVTVMDSAGTLYAGTNGRGVFLSFDNGESWQERTSGLTDLAVQSLAYSKDHYLYCGTASQGVFRSSQPVTAVAPTTEPVPLQFQLAQNYPNPFNPTTNIEFQIANSEFVSLKVFDLLGREVATLANEELKPGSYERTFDGNNLASGIYFYRLQAGNFLQTRKFVLLR